MNELLMPLPLGHYNIFSPYRAPTVTADDAREAERKQDIENNLTRALIITADQLAADGALDRFLTALDPRLASEVASPARCLLFATDKVWQRKGPVRWLLGISGEPAEAPRSLVARSWETGRSAPDACIDFADGRLIVIEAKGFGIPLDASQMLRYASEMEFDGELGARVAEMRTCPNLTANVERALRPHVVVVDWAQVAAAVWTTLKTDVSAESRFLLTHLADYLHIGAMRAEKSSLERPLKVLCKRVRTRHGGQLDAEIREDLRNLAHALKTTTSAYSAFKPNAPDKPALSLGPSGDPYLILTGQKPLALPGFGETRCCLVVGREQVDTSKAFMSCEVYGQAATGPIYGGRKRPKTADGSVSGDDGVAAEPTTAPDSEPPEGWRAQYLKAQKQFSEWRAYWKEYVDALCDSLIIEVGEVPVQVLVESVAFNGQSLKWQGSGSKAARPGTPIWLTTSDDVASIRDALLAEDPELYHFEPAPQDGVPWDKRRVFELAAKVRKPTIAFHVDIMPLPDASAVEVAKTIDLAFARLEAIVQRSAEAAKESEKRRKRLATFGSSVERAG